MPYVSPLSNPRFNTRLLKLEHWRRLTNRGAALAVCEQNSEVTKKISQLARFITGQKRKGFSFAKENQVR
jgi:hypothetical protein